MKERIGGGLTSALLSGEGRDQLPQPAHPVRNEPATSGLSASRRWLALGIVSVSLLITTIDATVLNVALPTLVRDLGATSTDLQWIVDAFVLVFAGLLLVGGSIADRFGRKWIFVAGLAVFGSCSLWAALSPSVGMLIAARAGMGVGGALIMPATLALITSIHTDPRERRLAFGIWSATTGAGAVLGPIIGGLLLAHFSWGSIFLINVPVAAIALSLTAPFVPNSRNPNIGRPDLLGSLLSMAGLTLLLWALIEAPIDGWSSGQVIGAGIGGAVVLAGFALWESRTRHPMLRLSFFRSRSFSVAAISVAMVMFALFGALFVLTQYLQFDLAYSALQTGLLLLPAAGTLVVVASLSSFIDRAIGSRLTVGGGLLFIAGGLLQMSSASMSTTYGGIVLGLVLVGIGVGLVIPSVTSAMMSSLPGEHTGVGAATSSAFLQVGSAFGVAVIGSLLSTRYQNHMAASLVHVHLPPGIESTILGSVGGALSAAATLGGPAGQLLAGLGRSAFVSAVDLSFVVGAAVTVLAALVAFLALPRRPAVDVPRTPETDDR